MKNTIKILTILACIAISFTACHKEPNNNVGKAHKAKYEVVSLGEEQVEISVQYFTQKGIGYGNGITLESERTITPWQHEFTFYDVFSFETTVDIENEYGDEYTPIKLQLYIDDKLVEEQQNNNNSFIVFTYFYNN